MPRLMNVYFTSTVFIMKYDIIYWLHDLCHHSPDGNEKITNKLD